MFAVVFGKLAHPFFVAFAWLLAGAFALVPNYAVAIALLTVVVMAALFPLTRRGTLGVLHQQRLAPELKTLQARFRASEEMDGADRQQLRLGYQEELAALYRAHGVRPGGGCLSMLVQLPIFAILLGTIRGLVHTSSVAGKAVSQPLYLAKGTALYGAVHRAHGSLISFGINLGDSLRSVGLGWGPRFSIAALVLGAVALGVVQMRQSARRSAKPSTTTPPKTMQAVLTIGLGLVYVLVPAAVSVYFVISSALRFAQTEYLYRHDRRVREAFGTLGDNNLGGDQDRRKDKPR